jgi:hypothetical protein
MCLTSWNGLAASGIRSDKIEWNASPVLQHRAQTNR